MDAAERVEFPRIIPPSYRTADAARERLDSLTKPPGSLGRLEALAEFYAAACEQCPPPLIEDVRCVVFSGDHGISQRGVSLYPPHTSVEILRNILQGGASVNALATNLGVRVQALDISLDRDAGLPDGHGGRIPDPDFPPEVTRWKICRSSGAIDTEDALSPEDTRRALLAGREIADAAIDDGAQLLLAGDNGIGNTTVAATLTGIFTATEPQLVAGRGSGISDATWMRKTETIRDAMFRGWGLTRQPELLLQKVGSADFAAVAGFLAQAAVRRIPAILDGLPITAAALVADALAPGARRWWIAGHCSAEPAHRLALSHLGLEPLLDLGMRVGEGTGAVMAVPLVTTAVAAMANIATFGESGVSEGVE